MNKNVLVTGGAGYIGSHICKALNENGFTPITFDNLSTGHAIFVRWGPFIVGDLRNQTAIEEVFERYEIKSVIHVAAKAYVAESMVNPIKYYRENIETITNLMEVFTKNFGEHLIFSSSCATYGDPEVGSIGESCPQNPVNPYGFTKLAGEKLIIQLESIFQFNYSILRYFNVAGADPGLELGEIHSDEPHLIPRLISAARNGQRIQIFGDDYDTPDGTTIRDFIHVSDLALAHCVALTRSIRKKQNLIANLGSGTGHSVLEVANSLKKFFPDLELEFCERRPGDPPRLVSKSDLEDIEFEWKPKHSKIDEILDSAINWDNMLSRRD
jgi:UDP-glucose-4-epimerase GalE